MDLKTLYLILSMICMVSYTKASYPEFFGTSAKTNSLGGQFTNHDNDADNVYYIPAQSAFADTFSFSINTSVVKRDFKKIQNIVIQNTLTDTNAESGDVNTDYNDVYTTSLHLILPILKNNGLKLAVSAFFPMFKVLESDTGDPYTPEYVMHKSRYKRSMVYAHAAYPLTNDFSFSVGFLGSFQTSTNMDSVQKLNGTTGGASASMKTKVTPSLSAITSVMKKFEIFNLFATYQQEMKTNLKADIIGVTASPTVPLDQTVTSMIAYDPHIFRIGSATNNDSFNLFASIEYQLWDNYKTPVIRIKQNGGSLEGSENYENISTKNIIIPKLGLNYKINQRLDISAGAYYRPTPIEKEHSASGNSIDSDSTSVSTGLTYKIPWKGSWMNLSFCAQQIFLKEIDVQKSTSREDGNTSENKIGYPGYKVGGTITNLTAGISFSY